MLDFGCGFGRTAVAILDYLEPGNYIGVDLSAERIRMCHEYVDREGLADRRPTFISSKDNAMSYLDDDSIDIVFATSVFSHMPMPEWREVLGAVRRVLKPQGAFIVNYHLSKERPVVADLKDFGYPAAAVEAVFDEFDYHVAPLDGWHDDLDEANRDPFLRVVKLTPEAR